LAGKSHPRDDGGKRYIQEIIRFCRRDDVRPRMVFIEDYDMNVARYLVQGVDVWLNTPRRPMEASGTSGMKGPINGAINLSILDGWWVEGYNGQNGWAIGSEEEFNNDDYQDEFDSTSLFDLLEKEVAPLFYDRGPDNIPRKWIARMKNSIASVCSMFNTSRQVQQYFEMFYYPASRFYDVLAPNNGAGAAELASWKSRLKEGWGKVQVREIDAPTNEPMMAGSKMQISATVELGSIPPEDVVVELYHGSLDANGAIQNAQRTLMARDGTANGTLQKYVGGIAAQNCGQQGFSVRILPKNANLDVRLEPGLIRWA
jgi:glycogen phosphorylase